MRCLYPPDGDGTVDLAATYAYPDRLDRPWVRANMVSSLDGAASVAGHSAGLSSPTDKRLFALLRTLADVVLVGAGTARSERYGPVRLSAEERVARAGTGQAGNVPIALVSRSLDLDVSQELFTHSRAIVVTCSDADPRRLAAVRSAADVIVAGEHSVDLGQAMTALRQRNLRRVLCEGGPRLLGDLIRSELLDELCLTVAPLVVGGSAPRVVTGDDAITGMALGHLLVEDGTLFTRYVRA